MAQDIKNSRSKKKNRKKSTTAKVLITFVIIYLFYASSQIFLSSLAVEDSFRNLTTYIVNDNCSSSDLSASDSGEIENNSSVACNDVSQDISETSDEFSDIDSSYDYELDLLARLVTQEASCYYDTDEDIWLECSDEWQYYVACVVLNRVESTYFPDTLEEVLFQEGQYESASTLYETEPSERAYRNSKMVLDGYRPLPKEVVFQAEFQQGPIYAKIGNTYFCYPET